MQALLDEAIADLERESVGTIGTSDYYYNGDADLWKKAAYAIKAGLHNHLSRKDPTGSANSVLSAVTKSFEENSDGMIFNSFTTDATGEHPWFQEVNDRSHHAISTTIFDLINDFGDPRGAIWFGTVDGAVVPAPNGSAVTDQGGNIYSRASGNYLEATSPLPIIAYDEVKFLEEEANFRLDKEANAYDAYLAGVEAALVRADVEDDDITDYLSKNSVAVGEDNLTLEHIIIQKYIAFWLFQPIEAYNDYRRTLVPDMNNSVSAPPNRFPYPQDEVAANPNVPSRTIQNKVWWAE